PAVLESRRVTSMFCQVTGDRSPCFPLFFLCSGPHRDLHSFPTRRSSDLRAGGTISKLTRLSPTTPTAPASASCSRNTTCSFSPSDRKSTRLNSSHRTISYAVFCLKKKNKGEDPGVADAD